MSEVAAASAHPTPLYGTPVPANEPPLFASPSNSAPSKSAPSNAARRTIHTQSGSKPVDLHGNVALTTADGRNILGTLVSVEGGFVEVDAGGKRVRVAERDVFDVATW
ncbi:MAG TPA: hypothetical protein VMV18_10675 [bacterium]|nr:hypothetical protein [bacterium]